MIDANIAVREWLLNSANVVALAGDRIFSPMIPQDYNPSQGVALAISTRATQVEDECPILHVSMQIEAWAAGSEGIRARELYRAVWDVMAQACNVDLGELGFVMYATEEAGGQDGVDPETKWSTVISFYRLMMRAN